MNNYIIDPMVFYWVSVSDSFRLIVMLLLFGSIVPIAVSLVGIFEGDVEEAEKSKKVIIVTLIIDIILSLGIIFIPSKKALIEMLIAKSLTPQNMNMGKDYVINFIQEIIRAIEKQ